MRQELLAVRVARANPAPQANLVPSVPQAPLEHQEQQVLRVHLELQGRQVHRVSLDQMVFALLSRAFLVPQGLLELLVHRALLDPKVPQFNLLTVLSILK